LRSLGEFFGHIAKAVRTDPAKRIARKTVDERQEGGMILRRTTIEEIELKDSHSTRG
jgi:hypothetical protein